MAEVIHQEIDFAASPKRSVGPTFMVGRRFL
jgi:hypothetical protein